MKRKLTLLTAVLVLLACILPVAILTANCDSKGAPVYGDLNGDTVVNNLDAAQVLKYDAAIIELTKDLLTLGDVNLDNNVNNLDAGMILRYDAGIIDSFPSYELSEDTSSFDGSVEGSSLDSTEDTSTSPVYPEGAYVVKRYDSEAEVDWQTVDKAYIDTYKWVDSVRYEAYGQLVFVEDYGFLCRMTCMESDPLAVYTQFGDPVYLDSCMEFFAAWDNESYVNIESNSLGTLCSQFGKTQKNRKPITDFLSMDEIFEVNPMVEDEYWTLTMELPVEKLQKLYGNALDFDTFISGYTFTGNFYKIGSDAVTGVRHYGMWTEVMGNTPNFHQPEYFGIFVME